MGKIQILETHFTLHTDKEGKYCNGTQNSFCVKMTNVKEKTTTTTDIVKYYYSLKQPFYCNIDYNASEIIPICNLFLFFIIS